MSASSSRGTQQSPRGHNVVTVLPRRKPPREQRHSTPWPPYPYVFGDLAEAETLRAGRGINEVVFELNAQTSLRHAEEVDNITRPGLRGFRLMNAELLHCKKRTKMELEKAYRRMRDQCLAQCDQEISTLDMQIAFVKQMIAHVGPPAEQRNQGVQRSMQLPAVYMPYQSYVIGPGAIPYQPPFPDISDRVASLFRDRFAQKAWWELNLVFLETRKQAAEEKKVYLERKLEANMRKALESPSYLGAGYQHYGFFY